LLVIAVLIVFILTKTQKQSNNEALLLMQQQIEGFRKQFSDSLQANSQAVNQQLNELTKTLNSSLQSVTEQMILSQKSVGERLDVASEVVSQVQKSLGSLQEATQKVFDVGKDVLSFNEILRAPKLRGVLGELFLGDLLEQILPVKNFKLQHRFKSGEIVDAMICLGQGSVSVDSKFPLENFRKIMQAEDESHRRLARRRFINDVKKHIDNIADKYIVPDENTFDFALMYIPAENVYYELIIKDNDDDEDDRALSYYALNRKVIPVSPNSFYAYLQAIILGLKGLRVEKNVQEIIQHFSRLSGDIHKFKQDFEVIGKHIVNLKNKYDEADKKIINFETKLSNICKIEEK